MENVHLIIIFLSLLVRVVIKRLNKSNTNFKEVDKPRGGGSGKVGKIVW